MEKKNLDSDLNWKILLRVTVLSKKVKSHFEIMIVNIFFYVFRGLLLVVLLSVLVTDWKM